MRSTVLALVAIALGASTTLGCGGSSEDPGAAPGGAPGESVCSETLPGAVLCREAEPGKPVVKGHLAGNGLATLTFADRIEVLDEPEHALRVVTRTEGPTYPLGVFDGRVCYAGGPDAYCAPVGGGDGTVWLRNVEAVVAVGDGTYLTVERVYDPKVWRSRLHRVDRDGAPVGDVLLELDQLLGSPSVVGERILVASTASPQPGSPSELLSIPLGGGAPTSLVKMPSTARFFVVKGFVLGLSAGEGVRLDLATGAIGKTPALGVDPSDVSQVGDTLVAIDRRSSTIITLDDTLQAGRVLYRVPAGPDAADSSRAVVGRALYLSFEHNPCTTSGIGKQSHYSCDGTRSRWQIARIDVPSP